MCLYRGTSGKVIGSSFGVDGKEIDDFAEPEAITDLIISGLIFEMAPWMSENEKKNENNYIHK